MGLSVLMASVLKLIPMPVLFGVFLFMGVSSMAGIQFLERAHLYFKQVRNHPQVPYVRRVSAKCYNQNQSFSNNLRLLNFKIFFARLGSNLENAYLYHDSDPLARYFVGGKRIAWSTSAPIGHYSPYSFPEIRPTILVQVNGVGCSNTLTCTFPQILFLPGANNHAVPFLS
jgi:hypothetical protein